MLNKKREIAETRNRRPVDEGKSGVMALSKRRYPIGAELIGENETHFRVWAPKAHQLDLVIEDSAAKNAKRTFHPLQAEEGGYFSGGANADAGAAAFTNQAIDEAHRAVEELLVARGLT